MAKASAVIERAPVMVRGIELLALIAASEVGYLMLTQDEGAEAVNAGDCIVDGSIDMVDGLAAVRLTDAGKAKLAPPVAEKSGGKWEIEDDVPMPKTVRRAREDAYPFAQLEIGQSFHVPATPGDPNPEIRLSSSVSSARIKFSEPTGEMETVVVKTYQRGPDGKGWVKDENGKRIVVSETEETRPVTKITKDFKVVRVGKDDRKGEGARVYRTA